MGAVRWAQWVPAVRGGPALQWRVPSQVQQAGPPPHSSGSGRRRGWGARVDKCAGKATPCGSPDPGLPASPATHPPDQSCAPRLAGPSDRGGRRPGTSTPPAAPTRASPRGPSSHPVPHHLAEHAPPVCPATLCHCAPSHCHFSGAGPGRDLGPVLSTSPATAVTSHGLAAHTADQQEPCAWARARGEGPRLAEPCREGGTGGGWCLLLLRALTPSWGLHPCVLI